MKNSFKEEDVEKVVQFLNGIAKHASFNHTLQQSLDFVKNLTYMQKELLPKIKDNIFEVKKVVAPKDDF